MGRHNFESVSATTRIGSPRAARCGWAESTSRTINIPSATAMPTCCCTRSPMPFGAAALGDIGELFPDTDEANRGRDSGQMLQAAVGHVVAAGWTIENLDCIVFAELPKLTPYKLSIRRRIAELVGIDADSVGLKAKTAEGLDAVGRREAIAAQCVALLKRGN